MDYNMFKIDKHETTTTEEVNNRLNLKKRYKYHINYFRKVSIKNIFLLSLFKYRTVHRKKFSIFWNFSIFFASLQY